MTPPPLDRRRVWFQGTGDLAYEDLSCRWES
uniref:Uncharacterized protein n=1 Tax=Arundo donax TaxID=35708 RepID=A0A0A8Z1M8_ARUDO